MAKLSNHQILDLAYKVGWRKSGDLERVLAIVLAESGGQTNVTSYTGCCHGLMQINTRVHTQWTKEQMFDAEANMRAGFALWQKSGWQPWNSSRGGQLLRGPQARASLATWHASPGVGSQGTSGAVGEATGAVTGAVSSAVPGLSDALGAAERLRVWVTTPANLGRLATGVIGAAIIVIGLAVLARPIVEPAAKAVTKAVV
jgi:Lysozyme like domain